MSLFFHVYYTFIHQFQRASLQCLCPHCLLHHPQHLPLSHPEGLQVMMEGFGQQAIEVLRHHLSVHSWPATYGYGFFPIQLYCDTTRQRADTVHQQATHSTTDQQNLSLKNAATDVKQLTILSMSAPMTSSAYTVAKVVTIQRDCLKWSYILRR